jgi:tape measure domain-containing protein
VEKLGVMGGASATALNAGLLQFGQAMSGGVVHAEEFNSLIENIPLVADRIAKGMGMTTASLRTAVLEGKVLSKDVFESLMKQAPQIAKEFEKLPPTLERSMSALKTSFQKAFGEFDQQIGLTQGLAKSLMVIADNAKLATNAIAGLATGFAIMKIPSLITAFKNLGAAIKVASLAAMSSPFTAAAAAIGLAVAALITFKDETFKIGQTQVSISSLFQATWEELPKLLASVTEAIVSLWDDTIQALTTGWNDLVALWTESDFVTGIQKGFQELQQAGEQIWTAMKAPAQDLFQAVSGGWGSLAEGIGGIWKGLTTDWGGMLSSATKMFGDFAMGALGIVKSLIDELMKIPFVKQFVQGIENIYNGIAEVGTKIGKIVSDTVGGIATSVQKTTEKAGAAFKTFADNVVKRAGELEKAKQKAGTVSGKKTEITPLVAWNKEAREFFAHQMAINQEMLAGITLGKQGAELEKLKAEFAKKVKREMTDGELAVTKQILENREKMQTLADFKSAGEGFLQEAQAIELQNTALDYQIPVLQMINKLKDEGRAFTEDQVATLMALAKANKEAQQKKDTSQYIQDLKDQVALTARTIGQTKDQAEVEKALFEARKRNPFITEDELNQIQANVEAIQRMNNADEYNNKLLAARTNLLNENRDAFKNLITDKGLKNQLDAYDKMMESVGKDWTKGESLTQAEESMAMQGAAMKTYLDDAARAQDIIKDTRTEQQKWNDELAELNHLASVGLMTQEQWLQAVKAQSPEYKKIKDFAEDTAKSFTGALDDWIFKGKKLSEVFKDLAKNLAQSVAKKALFDPLEKKLTSMITNGLWGNQAPAFPGGGSFQPNPGFGGLPFMGFGGGSGPFSGGGNLLGVNNPFMNNYTPPIALGNPLGGLLGGPLAGSIGGGSTITTSGPITINGSNLVMNGANNPLTNAVNQIKSTLGNLFNGFLGGLKSVVSIPFNLLGGLFGGGSGGGMGGLGGLFSGGLSKIGGLLNPLGLIKGLGSAIGGLFKAEGGSVKGGSSYVVGEQGPEIFTPGVTGGITNNVDFQRLYQNTSRPMNMPTGQMSPEQAAFFGNNPYAATGNGYLDMLAITQRTSGTPLYQGVPNFQPTMTAEQQAIYNKIAAYNAMSEDEKRHARTTGNGYPTNADWGDLMKSTLSDMDFQTRADINAWTDQYNDKIAEAVLRQPGSVWNNQRNWAADQLSNKTWAASTLTSQTAVALPLGNQTARIFSAMGHQGLMPNPSLMQKLNTRDWWADFFQPGGNWRAMFTSSGSKMGMAGLGSGAFQSVGYTDLADPKGAWGNPGSGLQSFLPPSIWGGGGGSKGYGDPDGGWGSGLGYLRGAHDPAKFKNNSLLYSGGNGVTNSGITGKPTAPNLTGPGGGTWASGLSGGSGLGPSNVDDFMMRMLAGSHNTPVNGMPAQRLADPNATGTGNTLKDMPGYRPEAGWSMGTWSNTLRQGSVNVGSGVPQSGWLNSIGTPTGFSNGNSFQDFGGSVIGGTADGHIQFKNSSNSGAHVAAQAQDVFATGWGSSQVQSAPRYMPFSGNTFSPITAGQVDGMMTKYGGKYARGGRPKPGAASWVGEDGPELFIPDTAGRVISNDKAMRGSGDVIVHLNVSHDGFEVQKRTAPNGDPEIIIQEKLAAAFRTSGGAFGKAVTQPRINARG